MEGGRAFFFGLEYTNRMMYEAIKNFHTQFAYQPEIQNAGAFARKNKFVVVGLGGSHLAADLLKRWKPSLDLVIHSDYGLPAIDDLNERLIICSSYSGNTEEVLDAFRRATEKKLSVLVVSVGGTLLSSAKEKSIPYIQILDTGIQPRSALGFSLKALLMAMGEEDALKTVGGLSATLKPENLEAEGKELAKKLKDFIPVIYASNQNKGIVYNWKIKFNETGKIPAFYNVLPELNHNEMTGFDRQNRTKNLSDKFYFVFLKDNDDDPRIQRRMEILQKLYENRGLPIIELKLKGRNVFEKVFSSLILADWAAYYTAEEYGVESEQVPMVEQFKKLI